MEVPKHSAKLGNYLLGRKIGSGCSSKVKEGFTKDGKFAIKYLSNVANSSMTKTYLELVANEAKVMKQLDHPNIIKLYEYNDKGIIEKSNGKRISVIYLVLELITGGELFEYVALTGRFSEKLARHYFKQLIDALEFIHSKGFAHRDIKAENLLLDSNYALKLADFGFSAELIGKENAGTLHTYKGTAGYMAPEIQLGQKYSGQKVDIFAVGVLLFIMVAQHPPFKKAVSQDAFYKLFCYNNEKFWEGMSMNKPPGTFSTELKSMVNSLLGFNPTLRPSIAEIKNHPWYNSADMSQEEVLEEFRIRREKIEAQWKIKAAKALKQKMMKYDEQKKRAALGEPNLPTDQLTRGSFNINKPKQLFPLYNVYIHNNIIGKCA